MIICGDLNVAYTEANVHVTQANPDTAGFTLEERKGMKLLISLELVDAYRHMYPDTRNKFTFWSYNKKARERNLGWRLDYFLIPECLSNKIIDVKHKTNVYGSDHRPVILELHVD